MPAAATCEAAVKPTESSGDDSGDPDSTQNWLYAIIAAAIRGSAGRLKPSSFGITGRTFREWSKRKKGWVPPPETLRRVAHSSGIDKLPQIDQRMVHRRYLVTTLEATRRGRPAPDEFIAVASLMINTYPEELWRNIPKKIPA